MTKLSWDQTGERFYQFGVDHAVLYPVAGPGVPWIGLTSVKDQSQGDAPKPYYLNGRKTQDVVSATDFAAVVTAFSAPAEFRASDGIRPIAQGLYVTQQPRLRFGFSFRTKINNDQGSAGYKLHIIYNAIASPAERSYSTRSDSTEPMLQAWTMETVPPPHTTKRPTAHLVINSRKFTPAKMTALENMLYGTSTTDPYLPTQAAIDAVLGG